MIEYAIAVGPRQRRWRRCSRAQQLQAVGRNTARKQGAMHAFGILIAGKEARDVVTIGAHVLVHVVTSRRAAPTSLAS